MFKFWIHAELYDEVMKEARYRGISPEYILLESFDTKNSFVYDGVKRPLPAKNYVSFPKGCLTDLSKYCRVSHYERVWPKQVWLVIRDWPRMSNARFVQRMMEAFPKAHPAVWKLREIRQGSWNDQELVPRFGAIHYGSLHFNEGWNDTYACEVLR